MNRLAEILNDTFKICDKGYYEIDGKSIMLSLSKECMKKAVVFTDKQIGALAESFEGNVGESKQRFSVVNTTSFESAYDIYSKNENDDILVLNFANPVNPGGGVYSGARAQEEDLCRKSTLLLSLESENAKEYYDFHRKHNYYTASDYMILSPEVQVFRNGDNTLSDKPFVVSVL